MNKSVNDYLSNNNTPDENSKNSTAIHHGIYSGLFYLLKHLKSYHNLIDLEIDSQSPAKLYLNEGKTAVVHMNDILRLLDSINNQQPKDFESIDFGVLVKAIVNRINKIGTFEITANFDAFAGNNTFISGNLFLLQQLFFDLLYIIDDAKSDDKKCIEFNFSAEIVDEDNYKYQKVSLAAGDYLKVAITQGKNASAVLDKNLFQVFESQILSSNHLSERMLYIYGVIRQHRGDMLIAKPGSETMACAIFLPLLQNTASMYTEKNIDETELKGNETILLVDDEDIIWDVVIDMLQNMGYVVILASNGRECVEIFRENPGKIDLVLLDMVMPEMNGHDAFFALKEIDPNVKVLLSSGYVNEDDARDVLNAGAAGFLQKPYRMIELAKRIKQIIEN